MRFMFQGQDYRLKFTHEKHEPPLLYGRGGRRVSHTTTCEVQWRRALQGKEPKWLPVLVGQARCSTSDVFCKETGRRLALRRAVANASRGERAAVCVCYFNRPHPRDQEKRP